MAGRVIGILERDDQFYNNLSKVIEPLQLKVVRGHTCPGLNGELANEELNHQNEIVAAAINLGESFKQIDCAVALAEIYPHSVIYVYGQIQPPEVLLANLSGNVPEYIPINDLLERLPLLLQHFLR